MRQGKILIVDDEELIRSTLEDDLSELGYQVYCAGSGQAAFGILQDEPVDLMLLDIKLPEMSGLDILEQVKKRWQEMTVIMISGVGELDTAVQAMKLGAYDYIKKPFDLSDVNHRVQKALERVNLRKDLEQKKEELKGRYGSHKLIGKSRAMQQVFAMVDRLATIEATTILLTGESGTGKDMVARAIHYNSSRAEKPFVQVNCAAIPDTLIESELFGHEKGAFTDARARKIGLFEKAHGGTLFLDEIGCMKADLQAKLLNVIESRRFRMVGGLEDIFSDLRLIAATNSDLYERVKQGEFREDLYYRLRVFPVFLPPLRERKEDIPLLAESFVGMFNQEFKKEVEGVTDEALKLMEEYQWPGNIRELKNVIERAVIMEGKGSIQPIHLPVELVNGEHSGWGESLQPEAMVGEYSLQDVEKIMIDKALEKSDGNISRAARSLRISRDQLRYRLKKWRSDEALQ